MVIRNGAAVSGLGLPPRALSRCGWSISARGGGGHMVIQEIFELGESDP
jgi:hypothetical protein